MNNRPHRVMFRLSTEEFQRYAPFVRQHYLWNWSELVRKALKEYANRADQAASDNAVRQAEPQTKQRPAQPSVRKSSKRPSRSGRVKAKV